MYQVLQLYETNVKETYSSGSMLFPLGSNLKPNCRYVGAHHASAPVTNATQVNPAVDSIKLGLKNYFKIIYITFTNNVAYICH